MSIDRQINININININVRGIGLYHERTRNVCMLHSSRSNGKDMSQEPFLLAQMASFIVPAVPIVAHFVYHLDPFV